MNRTDESRTIAVMRTRLPYTDRRSLSQAWFSALHLGDAAPSTPHARNLPAFAAAPGTGPRLRASGDVVPEAARMAARAAGPRRAFTGAAESGSGTIVPATARLRNGASPDAGVAYEMPGRRPAVRTSLTFGVAGERVALLLRREGATLHVVALCRPAVEGAVRRALVLAGAQVRSSGTALRAAVEPFAAERP